MVLINLKNVPGTHWGMVKLFQPPRDIPSAAWEELCEEQNNDSVRVVRLDNPALPNLVAWLKAHGADEDDEAVLVEICW